MIQNCSMVSIVDNSGGILAMCIKVLGSSGKKIGFIGDVLIVVIKKAIRIKKKKIRKSRIIRKGQIKRVLIVRTKVNFCRMHSFFIKFNENAGIIVNLKNVPMSNRVKGPILKELCLKNSSLGSVSNLII